MTYYDSALNTNKQTNRSNLASSWLAQGGGGFKRSSRRTPPPPPLDPPLHEDHEYSYYYVLMSLLLLLCHYYITFLCRFNARPKILLNLLWICEFRFKRSMSSLAVVFSLRPFLWGILAFRIVETVCKPFTLFRSKWETKLRYQDQLNHPTPRMTKQLLCCILPHVPWAPLHPTISPSLKRKRICYAILSFYLR